MEESRGRIIMKFIFFMMIFHTTLYGFYNVDGNIVEQLNSSTGNAPEKKR